MPVAPVEQLAPVYRYFTADVLTGEILAEIPFGGVSYERALKAAGAFRGKIPVIEDTAHLDLYETTTPGKTALYVVRNDVCVWGGIIWTRSYDVKTRILDISASEFTSYLYHRRIWKTWNHQYEAVIVVDSDGLASVQLTNGSTTALNQGTSVHVEFYDPANFKYNDYYTVASEPAPTVDGFSVGSMAKSVDLVAVRREGGGLITVTTDTVHNLEVGDIVNVSGLPSEFNGTQVVFSVQASTGRQFTYISPGTDIVYEEGTVSGEATRNVPEGTYVRATVTVRTDTFDYVRGLLDGMFTDFTGIDFPNVYIEPGISYPNDVINVHVQYGKARIQTANPHNLTIGQAVQIQDVNPLLDGEHVVTDTPSETEFWYAMGGLIPSTPIYIQERHITAAEASGGIAKLYTDGSAYYPGQNITVDFGQGIPDGAATFSGSYVVLDRDEVTYAWIRYEIPPSETIPYTPIPVSLATVGASSQPVVKRKLAANTVTLTTEMAHEFSVGNSVVVSNVTPAYSIVEKSLDAANSRARITTSEQHYLTTGDSVAITGLRDDSTVTKVAQSGTSVTLTLDKPHNFKPSSTVAISNLTDPYVVKNKQVTADIVTLTTDVPHNLSTLVGKPVTVTDIYDVYQIASKKLDFGTATITLTGNHNLRVNTKVTISGLQDKSVIVSKSYNTEGIVSLLTDDAHNFYVGDEIVISGLGTPYDGSFTVFEVNDYMISYDAKETIEKYYTTLTSQGVPKGRLPFERPPTKASGVAESNNSVFNGEHVVENTTATTFTFRLAGNNVFTTAVPAPLQPVSLATAYSFLNGTWPLTAASGSTLSYEVDGTLNVPSTPVPLPPAAEKGEVQQPSPTASVLSVHNGNRVITALTANTFTFTSVGVSVKPRAASGTVSSQSIFNGTYTITEASEFEFTYTKGGMASNVFETTTQHKAFVRAAGVYNGTYTITGVPSPTSFTYTRTRPSAPEAVVPYRGRVRVSPLIVVSTFGPYPKNADIGISYSTRRQSGIDAPPPLYRGFELATVGDVLDSYSDGLGGFEYRIDCTFDEPNNVFRKTFVFIPIDFPNPPAPGEISPVSRFGADKLVFEYPGNINNVTLNESAENAATRFFAIGETDLGPDVGPPFAVAAADDLLNRTGDEDYREWPLLDDEEKIDGTDDESILYQYAERYLAEARPPQAQFTTEVNGSLQPFTGTYNPGDWCSLVINDEFIRMRLMSDLEPRDDVLVRKIDGVRVTVPDGTTFPESVTLTLVPEWEVDKRG